jgi:uncharacterized membrane protein
MITSAGDERINEVRTTDDELIVTFIDGRTLSVPLVWYPRLLHASAEQRRDWRLIADGEGVHWPQIDEDLSAAGILRGVQAQETGRQVLQQPRDVAGATLSVLKFNDPYGADRVLVALEGLHEQQVIKLEDAAVVSWPLGNKKPTIRHLHSTVGAGALGGAFWGFLFGLIFFVPFLGAAIGAGLGALTGSMADVGIDDKFINQVRDKVTEGTSALFALTSGATAPDKIIDELKQYDFEIVSTNLPAAQEMQLREAFTSDPA